MLTLSAGPDNVLSPGPVFHFGVVEQVMMPKAEANTKNTTAGCSIRSAMTVTTAA